MNVSVALRAAIAATALIGFAAPAAAQPPADVDVAQPADQPFVETGSHITVIGAMRDDGDVAAPVTAEDESVPELPVVYEDEPSV